MWAHDFGNIYLAILPVRMMIMAIRLILIGLSDWFASLVRALGVLAAITGVIVAGMVMHGVDLSGDEMGIADALNMSALMLFLLMVIGWLTTLRTNMGSKSPIINRPGECS